MEEITRSRSKLLERIREALNMESWELEANIPDFILAEFLIKCFNVFNEMVEKRDSWYSAHLEPGNCHFEGVGTESKGGRAHRIKELRGAVARGWCSVENSNKEMDVILAEAVTQEVLKVVDGWGAKE